MGDTAKKMGRPRSITDFELLENLMRTGPSLRDTSVIMRCSETTVEDTIRQKYDMTFREFREKYMAETRIGLVKSALKHAHNGNAALNIFLLKNLCGYKDKHDVEVSAKPSMKIVRPSGETVVLDVGSGDSENR